MFLIVPVERDYKFIISEVDHMKVLSLALASSDKEHRRPQIEGVVGLSLRTDEELSYALTHQRIIQTEDLNSNEFKTSQYSRSLSQSNLYDSVHYVAVI